LEELQLLLRTVLGFFLPQFAVFLFLPATLTNFFPIGVGTVVIVIGLCDAIISIVVMVVVIPLVFQRERTA